eukprot:scaffold672_cov126-Cylindrotheca_fusiformis.AAC.21
MDLLLTRGNSQLRFLSDSFTMVQNSKGYLSIPATDESSFNDEADNQSSLSKWTLRLGMILCVLALIAMIILIKVMSPHLPFDNRVFLPNQDVLAMPAGINLASWLSLEDYFFVGNNGAVEVATAEGSTVAQCLPPLHVDSSTGPMWNSETDLFANLSETRSVRSAVKTFQAFRNSYLDFDEELPQIAKLGVKRVRVPVSWCLTDFDPSHDDILNQRVDDENDNASTLRKRYTCKDPFFEQSGESVWWPAVPKPFLQNFLRACAKNGIKATLDIHTYPGGTSPGTFSGVWPRKPLFWKYDDPENPDHDFGRAIYKEFILWIESLADSDPEAFMGVGAITPMNEPAHLAGNAGPGSWNPEKESYLPPLPTEMASGYLEKINESVGKSPSFRSVPDGPHLRSLLWQDDAISVFRESSLPARGVELHVNVHESVFVQSLVPDDPYDAGGRHPEGTSIFLAWWRGITTVKERGSWAVLDMHHYHAWEGQCQGTVDGPPEGRYTCGDIEEMDSTLDQCATWATMYRDTAMEQLGGGGSVARLASAEFSASTHHLVRHSCLDVTTLLATYQKQVAAADAAGVDLFWWGWKMPHGGTFRRAWSFKHFLHLLRVEGFSSPDESGLPCGD